VLDGTVSYADGRVRVTAHLTNGAANEIQWSGSYEHELSNIFAIQSDIALEVARALKAELSPAERERVKRVPTTSVPAYLLYLQAEVRWSRDSREETLTAISEVEQALELASDFTAAWVFDAKLHTIAQFYDPEHGDEHRSRGLAAARRALELDPHLGTAHAALGHALSLMRDWTGGEAAYREAMRRNMPLADMPDYAPLLLSVANFARAREILDKARQIVPEDPVGLRFLVLANAYLGEWQLASAEYDSGARLFMPWREGGDLMTQLLVGRNELERARAISDSGPINAAVIASPEGPEAALRELRRLYADRSVSAPPSRRRDIALWAAHFGDAPFALDAMRSAVTEQGGQAMYLWLPQFKQMRQLPEFKTLLREIGIVAYWQQYGWPTACRLVRDDDFTCD
jgi:tetratricopeptide (TPR) repeat protein